MKNAELSGAWTGPSVNESVDGLRGYELVNKVVDAIDAIDAIGVVGVVGVVDVVEVVDTVRSGGFFLRRRRRRRRQLPAKLPGGGVSLGCRARQFR